MGEYWYSTGLIQGPAYKLERLPALPNFVRIRNDRLLQALEIESPQNPKVKALARLRDKRGRNQASQFLIDGFRECSRAVAAGADVQAVICCPQLLSDNDLKLLHGLAETLSTSSPLWYLSPSAFEKVGYGQRGEGVVALANSRSSCLADLKLPERPLIVVVEGIEKPGNLGAVFRTADSVGADAVLIADAKVDTENPNAIRASLGTIFSVPHAIATTQEILRWLKQKGIRSVAARVDGEQLYHEIDYRTATAIVLGSEAAGLTQAWHCDSVIPVRIPMLGIADSLNISVSAAVILYEAGRQRGFA